MTTCHDGLHRKQQEEETMGSTWVSMRDQTVRFVLEHDGHEARARVSWEALQESCGHDWVDQTSLLTAFMAMESRIRQAALQKLAHGEEPFVGSRDLD
jgi:hypothetical protein